MQGSLTGFTLTEIFEMLATMKKTGVLEINSEEAFGQAGFRDGELYWAETSTEDESLDPADRRGQLKDRIEDAVLEIFEWNNNSYQFESGAKLEQGGKMSFSVGALLQDIKKRQAEWAEIRTEVPSMKAKIGLIARFEHDTVTLTRKEWEVAALVGKTVIVEELRNHLKCSPLTICRTLYEMSKKGLVRCLGEVEETESPRGDKKPGDKPSAEGKKYIRKSLLSEEMATDAIPVEWSSYYQLLDSRQTGLAAKRTAKARGH